MTSKLSVLILILALFICGLGCKGKPKGPGGGLTGGGNSGGGSTGGGGSRDRRYPGGGGKRSCPFLFLWDGAGYNYYTDLAGPVLAAGVDLLKPEFYQGGVYELGDCAALGGRYRMKLRETIYEADYLDEIKLWVVDLPAGYRALSRWSFTSQLGYAPPKDFMTVRDPRAPVSAVDDKGRDVLYEVSRKDEVPLAVGQDELSRVVLDFGRIDHPEHAKLVLTAWSVYEDLYESQRPPYSAGTTIETLDGRGNWVVRKVAGKNPGDRRTWVIDLANILTEDDTRMRLTLAHQPIGLDILDQVLLDDSVPVPFTVTRVEPARAELYFAGSTEHTYTTLTGRIHSDDGNNPIIPEAMMCGKYTKYGDVRPLLAATDDRFVLMAHGDAMKLEFKEPPRVAGKDRYVFLYADLFYSIKHSVKGFLTDSIYPLPFHGMKTYPYDSSLWKYTQDPSYHTYQKLWNTREIRPETI